MIIYNRRKRNAFIAEQFVTMKQTLLEAQRAEMMGTANEDQVQLLNQERAAFEEAEAKKLQGGIWKTITGVFSTEGLKVAENPSDLALVGEGGLRKMGEESLPMNTVSDPALDSHIMKSGILQALDEQRREGERAEQASGVEGGQLDRFAEQPTASTKAKGGWTSWITSK